jgi:hypothetical protein
MLFVDADIVVDAESVLRLLALSTGKDITAGMYTRRAEDRKFFLDIYINQNNTLEFDAHGMLRVENVATGFMMIQRHVFETMIQNHPEWKYFNDTYNRDEFCLFDFELSNGQYIGEDYTFCKRARADGFKVFVDPEITLPHVNRLLDICPRAWLTLTVAGADNPRGIALTAARLIVRDVKYGIKIRNQIPLTVESQLGTNFQSNSTQAIVGNVRQKSVPTTDGAGRMITSLGEFVEIPPGTWAA